MENLKLGFVVSALAMALTACSGSSGGGGAKGPGGGGDNKPTVVDGPNIEGIWISDCLKNQWGENRKMRLEVTGSSFYLKDTTFEDAGCHQVRKKEELRGTFSLEDKIFGDNYLVHYVIPVSVPNAPNATTDRYQTIKLVEDSLIVSEVSGTADGVTMVGAASLKKAASNSPSNPAQKYDLQEGDYSVVDGYNYQGANVGVGREQDGIAAIVTLTFNQSNQVASFTCTQNECAGVEFASYKLVIVDLTTFILEKNDGSNAATFKKN